MNNDKAATKAILSMYRRTGALRAQAARTGDDFLEYLYGVALKHLEERAGMKPKEEDQDGPSNHHHHGADWRG